MNHSRAHTALVKSILLALGSRPDLMLWENTTGNLRAVESDRRIAVGLPGSPDIIGVLAIPSPDGPRGRFIGIEVKTGEATLSPQQRAFHARAGQLGALLIVARSVDEAVAAVDGALARQRGAA